MSNDAPTVPQRTWSYPIVRPQRYATNYDTYMTRGGAIRIEELAEKYTSGNDFEDATRFFLFCHIFDQVIKEQLSGDFIEIGVYKGDTAVLLAEMARKLNRTAWLLDTFEGFDARDFDGIDAGRVADFLDTSIEAVGQRVGDQNTRLIKGYFPDSARFLSNNATYCLVHIDCDLYKPVLASLEYFYPRVVPGGFMIVHDYSSFGWDGAEKAVDEFFAERIEAVVPVPDSAGSVVVRKARHADGRDSWRQRRKVLSLDEWLTAANNTLANLLDDGWGAPEDWGIWGIGDHHRLSFARPGVQAASAGYELDLDVHAALIGPRAEQIVSITVDGTDCGVVRFDHVENRGIRVVPIAGRPRGTATVSIVLSPRFTESPNQLDGALPETRRLGVALHRLRLRAR